MDVYPTPTWIAPYPDKIDSTISVKNNTFRSLNTLPQQKKIVLDYKQLQSNSMITQRTRLNPITKDTLLTPKKSNNDHRKTGNQLSPM